MSFHSALRLALALSLSCLAPLACAVETQNFPEAEDDGGSGGSSTLGGSPPVSMAGTKTTTTAGSSAFGGTSSTTGGKGGSTSSGGGDGGASSSAGKGGSAVAGTSTGGNAAAGTSMGGSATGGSCSGVKEWKPADSTWTAAKDDLVQWMGKRYKVNVAIAYPNAECGPDNPAAWCASWWTADGSC